MPFYFDYHKIIKANIEERGGSIYFIDEDVNEFSFANKFISVYARNLYEKKLHTYFVEQFQKLPSHIDYILIIKGSTLREKELTFLKGKYCDAEFIMYQWDSVANYPYAVEIAKWCNKKITFDPIDAQKFQWKYRPLFFDPNLCDYQTKRDIDISFVCSLHSERVRAYQNLKKDAEIKKFNVFTYLYSNKWSYYRQRFLKRNKLFAISSKEVKFEIMSADKTSDIYNRSKCVLDFKFSGQEGLTIRSIESFGHHCKLITNNKQVVHEDFYNPQNVYIYDMGNFDIPLDFVITPYYPLPDEVYYKYSVSGWIDDVFG